MPLMWSDRDSPRRSDGQRRRRRREVYGAPHFDRYGRHEDDRAKSLRVGSTFAGLEQRTAETAAGPVAANEHRAHAGELTRWVEQSVVAGQLPAVGIELAAPAPAAAGDEL